MSKAPPFRNHPSKRLHKPPQAVSQALAQSFPRTLQELAPEQARLCLSAQRFLREEVGLTDTDVNGQKILVACSGGCDSTALVLILHYLSPRMGCKLIVAHLDHCLRPESADEAQYVHALCADLGLACISEKADIQALATTQSIGIEEAARNARYAFLETTREANDCRYVATAHHLNDLAEDVLMRLVRGTGWPALGGMAAYCAERKLIRPLLVTERNKLENFLNSLSISWCEDASNTDQSYFRNRIRSTFMPLFMRENPSFLSAVAGLWQLARTDAAHWTEEENNLLGLQVKSTISRDSLTHVPNRFDHSGSCSSSDFPLPSAADGSLTLTREQLNNASKALRLRLYKRCLESLGKGQPLLENLQRLDLAWKQNEGGKTVQFPGGKTATITGGNILFNRA